MAMRHRAWPVLGLIFAVIAVASWRGHLNDIWLTPDQQGRMYFERGDYVRAAQVFRDPLWKGIAVYAAGDFVAASAAFAAMEGAAAKFYLGNSLAHRDMLDDAMAAYEHALEIDPGFAEAALNLAWVNSIVEVRSAEYDDAGGTGGKLAADDFVFDDRARSAQQFMSVEAARAQGLTDQQLEDMWMRRVQTTPGDFLALKFSYQATREEQP